MTSQLRFRMLVLSLIIAALMSPSFLGACAGTPRTLEAEYAETDPESMEESTEDEEEEDAWNDANR